VMKKHPTVNMRKMKTMTTSDLTFVELHLFPFWCLDAKGGRRISSRHAILSELVCVGRVDMDF
jgi:hypothetical protein